MVLEEKDINLIVNIIDYAMADGYGDIKGYDEVICILKRLISEINLDENAKSYFYEVYGISITN